MRLKLPLGEALHGHHLHFCEAFRAVGQARSLTPAEAASDAPSNTFVPANMSQLCHELVCQGLRSLLLQHTKISSVNLFLSEQPSLCQFSCRVSPPKKRDTGGTNCKCYKRFEGYRVILINSPVCR